jgi:hypothetical protein
MHIIHVGCYQASECVGGEFTVQARYLGDLVDDGIAITPSHPRTVQAGQYMGVGGRGFGKTLWNTI